LAQAEDGQTVIIAEITDEALQSVRRKLPSLIHRRMGKGDN